MDGKVGLAEVALVLAVVAGLLAVLGMGAEVLRSSLFDVQAGALGL